jgi:hypothetical protein
MIRKWHGLVLVFAVGGAAAFTSAVACGPGSGGGGGGGNDASTPPTPGPPAVFVIDSTSTLFSFDAQGNSLAKVALPGTVSATSGGGITYVPAPLVNGLGGPLLYVTSGGGNITPYTLTLTPQPSPLVTSANPPPNLLGLAYDFNDSKLYVSSGTGVSANTPVCSYTYALGGYLPAGCGAGNTGGSTTTGVAYDPDDQAIWVAYNDQGVQGNAWEFAEDLSSAPAGANQGQLANPMSNPPSLSIAVCPKSATGGVTLVVVGTTNGVTPWLTSDVQEEPVPSNSGPVYGVSCDSQGNLYAATQTGLFRGKASATVPNGPGLTNPGITGYGPVPSGFAGLTTPIYGVFAGATNEMSDGGGGGGDGGASDAALQADGNGAGIPIPDDIDAGPSWCEQNSVLGPTNPAEWVAVPNPYGPGSFCCFTEPTALGWGANVCDPPNGWPPTELGLVRCYDYAQDCVAYYFAATSTLTSPGGLTPSGPERNNCSSAPPGYPVPSPYAPPSPSNPSGSNSPTPGTTCNQFPAFCNCVCDEGSASSPGGPY